MSENEHTNPSGSQNQSRTVSATAGGPQGGDTDFGVVQSKTIKRLDEVVVEYSAQRVALRAALESIHDILSENPTLTSEQRAQSSKLYEG